MRNRNRLSVVLGHSQKAWGPALAVFVKPGSPGQGVMPMRNHTHQHSVYTAIAAVFLFCLLLTPLVIAAPLSFEHAKIELRQKVYFDRNTGQGGDLYCGCDWQWVGRSGGRVDHASCGYEVRAQANRGERIEWEHVVPASTFGRQRQCWQHGGRANCTANDPVFNIMEADMFNLTPVVGELNGDRSNYNFGVLPYTPQRHGSCPFKVDNQQRTAEPPNQAKGMIARIHFYMYDRYGLNMSRQQQQLMMAWDKQYPVTPWELERHDRIARVMGHSNPYVTGERTWSVGQRPSGVGLMALPSDKEARTARTAQEHQQGTSLLAAITADPIIANQRSGVYHLPQGCPSYASVAPQNRIIFHSVDAAEAAGYRRAGNCR